MYKTDVEKIILDVIKGTTKYRRSRRQDTRGWVYIHKEIFSEELARRIDRYIKEG